MVRGEAGRDRGANPPGMGDNREVVVAADADVKAAAWRE
jgi:hypothetical protein